MSRLATGQTCAMLLTSLRRTPPLSSSEMRSLDACPLLVDTKHLLHYSSKHYSRQGALWLNDAQVQKMLAVIHSPLPIDPRRGHPAPILVGFSKQPKRAGHPCRAIKAWGTLCRETKAGSTMPLGNGQDQQSCIFVEKGSSLCAS